jgi:hypothetical protein
MERDLLIVQYFNKNWRKLIKDISGSNMVIDHSIVTGPIKDMTLQIDPHPETIVNGWKYVGPGDLVLRVYLDVDYILDYPVDHHMVARDFLIPWLGKTVTKWFGYDVYTDFADIVVFFYDNEGDSDYYDIPIEDTNVRSWMPTDKKSSWEYVGVKKDAKRRNYENF